MSQHKKSRLHHFPLCFFCPTHLLPASPDHTSTSDGGSTSPGHSVRKLKSSFSNVISVLSELSQRPATASQDYWLPHLSNISITGSFAGFSSVFICLSLSPFVDLQESSSGCLRTRCCSPDTPKTSPSLATGCRRRASRRRCGGRTWRRPTSLKATGG